MADIEVSVDGTWQRRGYSSLNGVVVAISIDTGKIVDLEVLTRYCRQCDIQNKLLKDNIEALNVWKEKHKGDCKLNHNGSAPAMKAALAKTIFERSAVERAARYTEY